jgi:hypothetical protein
MFSSWSFRWDRLLLALLRSLRRFVRLVREFANVLDSSWAVSAVMSDDCCLLPRDDVLDGTSKSERFFFGLSNGGRDWVFSESEEDWTTAIPSSDG